MDTNANEGEVKQFEQKVYVGASQGEDEELIDEDENETQPQSSEEENEPALEESEEETEEEEADEKPKEPKPVEGETPRERALRLEATRLKGLLRQQRQDELFVHKPQTQQLDQDEELAQYDPDELRAFESLAKKMGFAKRDEILNQTTQERNNTEFETFMEAHPEYAPENDKDGTLWNHFKAEFALYNPPQDPKTLRKVLNKVHSELFGVQPAKNLSKVNAAIEKIKVASHTGSSAGRSTRTRTEAPSGLRVDAMKGFTEKELKEMNLL